MIWAIGDVGEADPTTTALAAAEVAGEAPPLGVVELADDEPVDGEIEDVAVPGEQFRSRHASPSRWTRRIGPRAT